MTTILKVKVKSLVITSILFQALFFLNFYNKENAQRV